MIQYAAFLIFALGCIVWLTRRSERPLVVGTILIHGAVGLLTWAYLVPVDGTFVITQDFSSDDLKYFHTGKQILDNGTIFVGMHELGINVNPGFAYIVGFFFLIFGDVWFIPNGISFLAGALLPVLVVRLAGHLGMANREAYIAGWLMALLPTTSFFSAVGYKDALTLCAVVAMFLSLASLSASSRTKSAFLYLLASASTLAFLRIGMLPLVVLSHALCVNRFRIHLRGLLLVGLLALALAPLLVWYQSTQTYDQFIIQEVITTSNTGKGMGSSILSGGLAFWILRGPLFLLTPYPSLSGIEDAWQLYTWLNLGWYILLCLAVPGLFRIRKLVRESGNRLLYVPIAWAALVLIPLMIRGLPNARYILSIAPAVAIIASFSLTSRRALLGSLALIGAAPLLAVVGYSALRLFVSS
jgi:hypothetical protein